MMNGHHLPAGQAMQHDMNRRRPYNSHQQYHNPTPAYNGYYNSNYYPQGPSPYQHGGMPPSQYPQYPPYGRSPPPQFQQYVQTPPVVPSYPRPQPSPAIVTTPHQSSPHPAKPSTQSSTQSSYTARAPPTPTMPQVPHISPALHDIRLPVPYHFEPPLPWFSRPDLPWPEKPVRVRRKRKPVQPSPAFVELPATHDNQVAEASSSSTTAAKTSTPHPDTPSTIPPSLDEAVSTPTTTTSSLQPTSTVQTSHATPAANKAPLRQVAAVPIVPVIPKPASRVAPSAAAGSHESPEKPAAQPVTDGSASIDTENTSIVNEQQGPDVTSLAPAVSGPPKLWTGLFKGITPTSTVSTNNAQPKLLPSLAMDCSTMTNSDSLSDALHAFNANVRNTKIAFLEPRGLTNTGNMCYMNSVLQVLIFCVPFYEFLDQVAKRVAHSFKSDTPLIDAMIMFMREFPIIDSAVSVDQLRLRLKDNELERYGEQFTPDFVYDVIRRLPRFSTMRRGHQQDAEEFLGFLLEGLHDECVQVMQSTSSSNKPSATATPTNIPSSPTSDVVSLTGSVPGGAANGWLEVGPKQRPAVTRSSGTILLESPITKIFGGSLRSELRVPGMKNSVTIEPYQPLQLDIGSPHIHNIVDALKGLTKPETLHGDFKSPRGPGVTATKQVLIESLPAVLILHLKRFQYDNTGGTQKIWKKVGYPLELEIPKEVFSRQKQGIIVNQGGLPRYRLIAVVYHHGKNASGGHYTVDVRRQDGREWIRLDDTVIRRVRREDVAEGGNEEDPKILAAALDAHKKDTAAHGNIFAQMKMDENEELNEDDGWKQVNGSLASTSTGANKKWSSLVNGATTPTYKNGKTSVKDNKVAYLLFYQRIDA